MKRTDSARAFTRTELLVVLAVVAVVGLIHRPLRANSRGATEAMVCQENLHRLTSAWRMYATDSEDVVAPAGQSVLANGKPIPSWIGHYETNGVRVDGAWLDLPPNDDAELRPELSLRKSLLWPCVRDDGVYRCPADKSTGRVTTGPSAGHVVPRVRSMSMNAWVGGPEWSSGWRVYRKLNDFVDPGPTRTFVFLDERGDSINDGYFIVDMTGYPSGSTARRIVGYPASWHGGGGDFSFADGHTELWKWRDPRTMPRLRHDASLQLDIPSANNPDVLRIQDVTTRRVDVAPR